VLRFEQVGQCALNDMSVGLNHSGVQSSTKESQDWKPSIHVSLSQPTTNERPQNADPLSYPPKPQNVSPLPEQSTQIACTQSSTMIETVDTRNDTGNVIQYSAIWQINETKDMAGCNDRLGMETLGA